MNEPGSVSVEGLISRLATALSASATSLTLDADYDSFPTANFQVKIGGVGGEIVGVTARSGATLSGLTRAEERTAAQSWTPTTSVEVVVGGEAIAAGSGGGGSQPVQVATKTLTQADIQALPTSSFVLVPAVDDNTVIIPIWMLAIGQFGADYTNFNAIASMEVSYTDQAAITLLNFVDAFGPSTLADFFAHQVGLPMTVFSPLAVLGQSTDPDRATYPETPHNQAVAIGSDLVMYIINHGDGNLTGGDPGDVLQLTVLYTTVEAPQ